MVRARSTNVITPRFGLEFWRAVSALQNGSELDFRFLRRRKLRWLSSALLGRVVWQKVTDVSEVNEAVSAYETSVNFNRTT
jgi:hypothetical protein